MSDSLPRPAKKRWFDFGDILSLLDDRAPEKRQPRLPPAQEPPMELPPSEPVAPPAKAAIPLGPSTVEPAPAPERAAISVGPPPSETDNSIVAKLLADADLKNAEILRLNNELLTLRYEARDKDMRIASLMQLQPTLKEKEDALEIAEVKIREQDGKIVALEAQIGEITEQLDALRRLSGRAAPPSENAEEAAAPEQPEAPAAEEDAITIFKRIAAAREPENSEPNQPVRKPRSAKLYDL